MWARAVEEQELRKQDWLLTEMWLSFELLIDFDLKEAFTEA